MISQISFRVPSKHCEPKERDSGRGLSPAYVQTAINTVPYSRHYSVASRPGSLSSSMTTPTSGPRILPAMQWSGLDYYDPTKMHPYPDISLINPEPRCHRHVFRAHHRVCHFAISGGQGSLPHESVTPHKDVILGHSAIPWPKKADVDMFGKL
jgi:hypothetical protein